MRVALVNPPFSKLVYGSESPVKSITPCLGLFYLKAYCDDLGDIRIFEGEFYDSIDQLVAAINEYKPDIVGVTTNTSTYEYCKYLARHVSARMKVAGGPYSSFRIEESLTDFDLVFQGDAELGFRSLLGGLPVSKIPGCAYRDAATGRVVRTPNRLIDNLDEIPFPDHGAMQIGLYQSSPHREMPEPFATMMTTRGCGFACSFCLSAAGGMNGGAYRERSVAHVIEEVKILVDQFGIRSIQFWDDTFTMRKDRTLELCKQLSSFGIRFVCNTRTDKIDEEVADSLVTAGCANVFFGVESGDEFIDRQNIFKNVKNNKVREAFSVCKAAGLQTTASFIFGAIDDTEDSIRDTMRFAQELNPEYALFNIYTAHPGTKGYASAVRSGIIDEYRVDVNLYKGEPAGVPTVCRKLSRADLLRLKYEAYISFYERQSTEIARGLVMAYRSDLDTLNSE